MLKKSFSIAFFLLAGLLSACALTAPGDSTLEPPRLSGKLSVGADPLAGGWVEAYPLGTAGLGGEPAYRSAASAADGRYQLQLPPGTYFLLAHSAEHFAYYGRNPVNIPETGLTDVNLAQVKTAVAAPTGEPFVSNGIFGAVSYQGKPLAGAMVYVYLDLTSDLKGMGYVMAGPSDAAGIFEAELPPGNYYLLARKRQSGSRVGPLSAGDFIGYYPGNPVRIGSGDIQRLGIPMLEVPAKVDKFADQLFGKTAIQGVIRDQTGQPLAGVRAVLYDDPQMLNRPLYVSQPTGADGHFSLSLPSGGTYYLAARNTLGGAPAPGDLYGTYDGSPDHSLVLKDGQTRTDLTIAVEKVW